MAEIVSFSTLTDPWAVSLHYLVKSRCSKFLPNTGFVTVRLLRFGVKVKRAYCRDNLSYSEATARHAQVVRRRFFMFQQDDTSAHQHVTPSLSWSERETRGTRRRLSACVRVSGAHFEHEFWQFWADLSWQLITLLNKPYSVYCGLTQSSDSLLQIIHFNVT